MLSSSLLVLMCVSPLSAVDALPLSFSLFFLCLLFSLFLSLSLCCLSRHHCDTTVTVRYDVPSLGPNMCLPYFCSRAHALSFSLTNKQMYIFLYKTLSLSLFFSLFLLSLISPLSFSLSLSLCVSLSVCFSLSLSLSLSFFLSHFLFLFPLPIHTPRGD